MIVTETIYREKRLAFDKERNSLLASIDESLKVIANKENSSKELYEQTLKDAQQHANDVGKSAFTI